MKRLISGLRAISLILASLWWINPDAARAVIIDSFESAASPALWTFSNGPEYPGATGSLSRGTGHTGFGAQLAFNLTAGGNYVSATDWLPTPVAAGAVQFWVKNSGGVRIQVRVNDSTGQTLQYSPTRPFEAGSPGNWYQVTVQLGATADHWGGVNDGLVHGSVACVSILAQPTLALIGAIDFDDVSLIATPATLINPASAPVAVPAAGLQHFAQNLGVEITHSDATVGGLNLVRSLGFHRIRTEMFWADIETVAGAYNFSWYDQLVANLKARGILPHFILCYGNPIYTGGTWFQAPLTPGAVKAFGNFAKAAAAHYAGQGVHFEVWNEPDSSTFWNPPSASAYSALCQVASAQVHAGDPTAPVVSGGLAGIDLPFLDQVVAAGGTNDCDAIGIHPYRVGIPEQLADDLPELTGTIAQAFPSDPPAVWSTEAGYSSAWYGDGTLAANRTTQAIYGVRQILTGLGLGLPVQVVFALSDHGTNAWDSEDNFGMVDANYQTKPLATAVRALMGLANNTTFTGILPSPKAGLHVFKFQSSNFTYLVLWSENASTSQTVSFAELPLIAVDYLRNPVALNPDGTGHFGVAVSNSPVYVRFNGGSASAQAAAPAVAPRK